MLTAPRIVRTERAVRPCLPITLPTSCGATFSLRTVFSSRFTVSTATASGSSTSARAISRTRSSTASISSWVMHVLHPQSFRIFQTIFTPKKHTALKSSFVFGEILSAYPRSRQQDRLRRKTVTVDRGTRRLINPAKSIALVNSRNILRLNLRPLGRYGHCRRELLDQLGHAIGKLRAHADPILDALMLQVHSRR